MPDLPLDPAATRAVYERQWALLVPVVDGLRDAATGTSPLVAEEWRGHAADAARDFLVDLRADLQRTADAVEDAAAEVRHRLLELA